MYVVITAGCAECYDPNGPYPLVEAAMYATEELAKENAFYSEKEWTPHPLGGVRAHGSQGEDWVISLADFAMIQYMTEAYCIQSGYPVRPGAGDRCLRHGDALYPCEFLFRIPECQHTRWPEHANGSDRCPECGVVVKEKSGDNG